MLSKQHFCKFAAADEASVGTKGFTDAVLNHL
jgi:hypothetical protein